MSEFTDAIKGKEQPTSFANTVGLVPEKAPPTFMEQVSNVGEVVVGTLQEFPSTIQLAAEAVIPPAKEVADEDIK